MKRRFACYLMLSLFVGGFLACGDSDDEQEAQPTPTTQNTTPQPQPEIAIPKIDFAAEQAAIEEVIALHFKALKEQDVDDIMDQWLKAESDEVFITVNFLAAATCETTWSDVKNTWAGLIQFNELHKPMTIEEIGIDKRGKNATIRGTEEMPNKKYEAALRKDAKGNWKIRAVGFLFGHKFDHCRIEWIETPK